MILSKYERYSLSNQLRILEALYPSEADDLAVQREAVEKGYFLAIEEGMEHIYDSDSVVSLEECEEVWSVMNMFLAIDQTIKALGKANLHDDYFTRFRGYDGNNEAKFMGFAEFTIKRMGRFAHLPLEKSDYLNSHMPIREMYLSMHEEWQRISLNSRFPMSEQDLIRVLSAGYRR